MKYRALVDDPWSGRFFTKGQVYEGFKCHVNPKFAILVDFPGTAFLLGCDVEEVEEVRSAECPCGIRRSMCTYHA